MVAMSKVDGKSTMNARGTVTRQIFKYWTEKVGAMIFGEST
jgi:hypothetical protein